MTLEEIKTAVNNGLTVYCGNKNYTVIKDKLNQWLIFCPLNGYCIGLTWQDNKTLNSDENDFFII